MLEGFQEVTDRDFYDKVMASVNPTVVVFINPNEPQQVETINNLFQKHVKEHAGKINFYYLDVTKNTSFEDFGIFNFPAIMYFRDTMELDRHDFIPTQDMVDQAIKRLLRLA